MILLDASNLLDCLFMIDLDWTVFQKCLLVKSIARLKRSLKFFCSKCHFDQKWSDQNACATKDFCFLISLCSTNNWKHLVFETLNQWKLIPQKILNGRKKFDFHSSHSRLPRTVVGTKGVQICIFKTFFMHLSILNHFTMNEIALLFSKISKNLV